MIGGLVGGIDEVFSVKHSQPDKGEWTSDCLLDW